MAPDGDDSILNLSIYPDSVDKLLCLLYWSLMFSQQKNMFIFKTLSYIHSIAKTKTFHIFYEFFRQTNSFHLVLHIELIQM